MRAIKCDFCKNFSDDYVFFEIIKEKIVGGPYMTPIRYDVCSNCYKKVMGLKNENKS